MELKKRITDFHQLLKKTIDKYHMLNQGDKVLTAVSGGPDSVALLMGLSALADEYNLKLHIFHLNHQLRDNGARDARFVSELGRKHNLETTIESFDVGDFCRKNNYSIQAGARIIRYSLLDKTATEIGAQKIATGHNADDVVETFLMRLLKGSGLSGLTGIPPVRNDGVIRPLIETKRIDIDAYLSTNGFKYIVDETNLTDKYWRNRVRHHLVPALAEQNPDYVANILYTCETLRRDDEYLAGEAYKLYKRIAAKDGDEVIINIESLRKLDPALGYRLLRLAESDLTAGDSHISSRRLSNLWEALKHDFKRCDLSSQIGVCLDRGQVVIFLRNFEPLQQTKLLVDESVKIAPDIKINLSLGKLSDFTGKNGRFIAFADAEKIAWPLSVQSFQSGDRFIPLGMTGKKKLHDFFIDEKVPRRFRRRVPIIADENHIIWVGGYRLDERAKVTKKTTKIAIIKLIMGESL